MNSATSAPERVTALGELSIPAPATGGPMNIVLIYQNEQTRAWAKELHEHVTSVAGKGNVRPTWWKLSTLSEPGVLAGAVSKAMRADMIVVAVNATEGLPLPFYVWVNAWMPHRLQVAGALVALLGVSQNRNGQSTIIRGHLRAVAKQSRLDFLVDERKVKPEPANGYQDDDFVAITRACLTRQVAAGRR